MLRPSKTLLVLLLVLLAAVGAQADTFLRADLTNAGENPPTHPSTDAGAPRTSFGTAFFDLNDAMTAMTFSATVSGIDFTGTQTPDQNDDLRAAHIHASASAGPGVNAGVVWGFFGSPFNDNNPNDVVLTPFSSGAGATISGKWDALEGNGTTLADQLPNILSGHAYINFHTNQFPGGEIRGTLVAVPEPGTLALLEGIGVCGLSLLTRRRR
jgi:hypothetical protein